MGKKSKLPKFLEAMKKVILGETIVILTDKELLTLTNSKLNIKNRVALSTFEFWKTTSMNHNSPENFDSVTAEMVEDFRFTLDLARVQQKMNLTSNLLDGENRNQWGSTWILERKYDDLKLKQNIEINHNPIIQITGGDAETNDIISGLIGDGIEDIDFIEITKDEEDDEK
jgi:hypothetical protein